MSRNPEQAACERQRLTRTVFADTDGTAAALAEILGGANVNVAGTLEEALASDAEVLVLSVDERRELGLSTAQVKDLKARKLLFTGGNAVGLGRELDLDVGGGMAVPVEPIKVLQAALGQRDERAGKLIEPLAQRPAPRSFLLRLDSRHLAWRHVRDEIRFVDGKGFIEVLAAMPSEERRAVMTRQANSVFAGVVAPPDDWSTDYRALFRRVVDWLAARELEEFRIAEVPRQVHPPGTVRFDLEAYDAADADITREFHFLFDRPTVLTAMLRPTGSDAAMLLFRGGPKGHAFTREDTEDGGPLTISVALRQRMIDAMAGRYWVLMVTNFDHVNGMSAELTVRYDTLDGGAIQPMPSDASFEFFHWFAERLETGNAQKRRRGTARSFGFDDWQTLIRHVAWSEVKPPKDGARMRDIYFAQAQAKHGESFGLAALTEFNAPLLEVQDDLRRAIEGAFAIAGTRGHAAVGVEHLLLALLTKARYRTRLWGASMIDGWAGPKAGRRIAERRRLATRGGMPQPWGADQRLTSVAWMCAEIASTTSGIAGSGRSWPIFGISM